MLFLANKVRSYSNSGKSCDTSSRHGDRRRAIAELHRQVTITVMIVVMVMVMPNRHQDAARERQCQNRKNDNFQHGMCTSFQMSIHISP